MGLFGTIYNSMREHNEREREVENRRQRQRDTDRDRYNASIQASIDRWHERSDHNYMRRQVMKENERRRRNGEPELPVPPGDWR